MERTAPIAAENNVAARFTHLTPDATTIHHDLDALAGTWSAEEAAQFLSAIADMRQCDQPQSDVY